MPSRDAWQYTKEMLKLLDPMDTKSIQLSRLQKGASGTPGGSETAVVSAILRALYKMFGYVKAGKKGSDEKEYEYKPEKGHRFPPPPTPHAAL